MAEFFGVNVDTIGLHIRNISREEELETSTYEESSVVRLEGKRQVKRSIRIVRHISNIYKDGENAATNQFDNRMEQLLKQLYDTLTSLYQF